MWQLLYSSVSASAILATQGGGDFTLPDIATQGVYHVGRGVWTWFNSPQFIDMGNDELAVTACDSDTNYENGSDGIIITALDVTDGSTRSVESELLGFNGGGDDHNTGALLKLSSGTVLSLAAAHPSSGLYLGRATNGDPTTITAWSSIHSQTGTSAHTYCNLFELDSKAFQFGRTGTNPGNWYYTSSADDGVTWATHTDFMNGIGGYSCYMHFFQRAQTRLDFFVTTGHPRDTTNSVYHGYYDAANNTFHKTDGTAVSIPAIPTDFTLAYDGSSTNAWLWDIKEFNGDLYGLISKYPDYTTNDWADHRYQRLHLSGTTWSDEEVGLAGGSIHDGSIEEQYSGGACFAPDDPDVVFGVHVDHNFNASADKVCTMQKFTRNGVGDWTASYMFQTDFMRDNQIGRPRSIIGSDFIFFWAGRYPSFSTMKTEVFCFHKDHTPREMGVQTAQAWRLRCLNANACNGNMQLAEIEFRETIGGADITDTIGGTSIASSVYNNRSDLDHANAFNGNTGDRWAAQGWRDSWIGWDAGAGNSFAVSEIAIRAGSVVSEFPTNYLLEYSLDGTNWTSYCFVPGSEPLSYRHFDSTSGWQYAVCRDCQDLFVPNPQASTYRFFRWFFFEVGVNGSSRGSWIIENIKLRDGVGTNLITGTDKDRFSDEQSGNEGDHAFLDDTQIWYSNQSLGSMYLEWDMGVGNEIYPADCQIRCRSNSSTFREPRGFLIQASNNGFLWDTIHVEKGLTWTLGETKTFTLVQPS